MVFLERQALPRRRQRYGFGDAAAELAGHALHAGQLLPCPGLLDGDPGGEVRHEVALRRAQQVERVGAATLREGAVFGVAEPERHRDGLAVQAGVDVGRSLERAVRRGQPQDLAVLHVERACGLGTQLDPVMPGDLGDRVGVLEQPGLVGASAVVQQRVGVRQEDEAAVPLERRLGVGHLAGGRREAHGRRRGGLVEYAAVLERRPPEVVRVAGLALRRQRLPATAKPGLPARIAELGQRAARLLGRQQQDVAGGAGVEHRLHDRLHEAPHPGPGRQVVPPLERVVLGQQQVALRRGLIQEERRRDLEGHLLELVGEPGGLGQRVDRIGVVHQQHRDLAALHRRGKLVESREAIARGELGAEPDRLPDVARDVVEQVDRGAEVRRPGVLGPDAARHRQARLGRGELAGHPHDPIGRHAGLLRRGGRGVLGERSSQSGRRAIRGGYRVRDGQHQRGLRAGPNRQPLVGIEPGEVAARARVDELGDLTVGKAVRLGEAALVFRGREPGVQEIGPEREDVLGGAEVVRRKLIEAEHPPVGRPDRLVIERRPPGDLAAQRRGPLGQEVGEGAGSCPAQHRHLPAGRAELGGEPSDRIIPGDLAEAAVGLPRHGRLDASRVVQALQRGLAARAQLALIDRMLGIALQLDRSALPGAHVEAAAGLALGASAGVPGGHSRDLVLGLDQIRNQLLDLAGRAA